MTDKTAIDALKKICSIETGTWDNPVPFSKLYHEAKGIATEALAAIEAEKPAGDALNLVYQWRLDYKRDPELESMSELSSRIQHFAESYRAEQCKACRKDRQQLPEDPRV